MTHSQSPRTVASTTCQFNEPVRQKWASEGNNRRYTNRATKEGPFRAKQFGLFRQPNGIAQLNSAVHFKSQVSIDNILNALCLQFRVSHESTM